MFWAPGWVQRDPAQTLVMIDAAAAQSAWVFEGNRASNYAGRAARADLIVFLDLPRILRLWRILRRRVRYHGQTRPEMPADCPERLDPAFLAEAWRWDRRKGLALLAQMQGRTRTLHLTSRGAVRNFSADPDKK
jgi:adenylate kinase family enzyme